MKGHTHRHVHARRGIIGESAFAKTGYLRSLRAGKRAAAIMSLIRSAQLNGHEPLVYLKDVLTRPPTHRAADIDELLPHRWKPSASAIQIPRTLGKVPSPGAYILRDAACDQIGSMIASAVPLKNLRKLSERVRPPLWYAQSKNGIIPAGLKRPATILFAKSAFM